MSRFPAPLDLPSLASLPRPLILRRIAFALAVSFLAFVLGSLMVPWQQNAAGEGRFRRSLRRSPVGS